MNLNWLDIALHGLVSLAASLALLWLGLPRFLVPTISLVFWLGRELWQHRKSPGDVLRRRQSLFEWLTPVLASAMASGIFEEIRT